MYWLSDILFIVVYHVARYRRRVTRANLSKAYPGRTAAERLRIERAYYRHLCDLLVEGVYGLYAPLRCLMGRYRFANRELVNRYYEQGRSVILLSSHYNNWEYMVATLGCQVMHHAVGVGKPLDDKWAAGFVTRRRSRFGTKIADQTNVRETFAYFEGHGVPTAYMMLADQSPSNERKSYWVPFLHQETPFLYGAEYFARKYNIPVLYYEVAKVRRGRYEVRFAPLCDEPRIAPQYSIVSEYIRRLGETLRDGPQYWLWSHRRWKRRRPADVPLHPSPCAEQGGGHRQSTQHDLQNTDNKCI